MNATTTWKIWVDTGGTFTDCIALNPEGHQKKIKVLSSSCLRGKVLSQIEPGKFQFSQKWPLQKSIFAGYQFRLLSNPQSSFILKSIDFVRGVLEINGDLQLEEPEDFEITANEEAPILASRLVTETPLNTPLPAIDMRLGFTKGTNALLEKKGAKVTLLITKGYRDLLAIGTQQRHNLFQLNIPDPELFYDQVIEVEERIDAKGEVLSPIRKISQLLPAIKNDSIAIALLNAYQNDQHEQLLKSELLKAGKTFISCSNELSPTIKLLPRAQTSLVNAYLAPVLDQYLKKIKAALTEGHVKVMTSAGGLSNIDFFYPKDSLLSGPAGGVVGASKIAKAVGYDRILTFDMGGTSTDTARFDSQFDYSYTTQIGGLEVALPTINIETVAAGGGSICFFADNRLQVGPQSAGAHPGPACYGAGGPLTITDVNLLLGKLDPNSMGIPLNIAASSQALQTIAHSISEQSNEIYEPLELLRGFEKIANQKMAAAIRKTSISQGFDPKDYALLAFGGAGGIHVCQLADTLGIKEAVLPFDGGLLSAYGIGMASIERLAIAQINKAYNTIHSELVQMFESLVKQAKEELKDAGVSEDQIRVKEQFIYLRFQGQDTPLEINFRTENEIASSFEQKYQTLFGYYPTGKPLEVESIKVVVASQEATVASATFPERSPQAWPFKKGTSIYAPQALFPFYYWPDLPPGASIKGPAVLVHDTSTAFIEEGWALNLSSTQDALLRRIEPLEDRSENLKQVVELELFTNRFTAIAEEMGAQLQRTAFSVNIKERLDFSCALLDAEANLLVNAPHIPVHLGSLGVCARLVKDAIEMEQGDVVITNHPKFGGSHLPDITLLAPVFHGGQKVAYVVNRAHHAELGGASPGSMPPDATTLEQEGVVIQPTYLVKSGEVDWLTIENLLQKAKYPSRSAAENLADIKAALASLRSGQVALENLFQKHGLEKVLSNMAEIKQMASRKLLEKISPLKGKTFKAEETLDDGSAIQVKITYQKGELTFDFTGTSPVHERNLNANPAIVHSAILYVLRILCDEEIPLNDGLMEPVKLILPKSLLNPEFYDDPSLCPAVVGGNTEVSQRLVDTLLKALGLAACSQGTMNNFLFGNDTFGYYETIGGGTGAGADFHGRSGIHQHMTNTRITDPEDLEWRYPVRLERFEIRKNSGGPGKWKGGDGLVRSFVFLEPVTITVLAQHRKVAPYGMEGGEPGKTGEQYIERTDGWREYINGAESYEVGEGDTIVIKTPGGGGWGVEES